MLRTDTLRARWKTKFGDMIFIYRKPNNEGLQIILNGLFLRIHLSMSSNEHIALDQTIECSINRHGKSHGGINGRFIEETIAVWTNSFGFHAVLTNILHDVCDIETDNNGIDSHVECTPIRQTIDEQDLTKIMNKLKQEKLFSPATNEFRTLMSDKLVHEDVINNISTCFDRGLEAMASYVKYRLIKKVVPIDEPLKAMYYLKLSNSDLYVPGQTFSLNKSNRIYAKSRDLTKNMQSIDKKMRNVLIVAEQRRLPLPTLLNHEFAAASLALCDIRNADFLN
ncbi:unnamed protein product [Rotaria sp. Silwood2]|nr:unnamed protein product [Rotaria sp. Silwood2]